MFKSQYWMHQVKNIFLLVLTEISVEMFKFCWWMVEDYAKIWSVLNEEKLLAKTPRSV